MDAEALCAAGADAVLVVVGRMEERIEELERRLDRSSRNSSQPPSADGPGIAKRSAKKGSGRSPGGQPGHRGHHRQMVGPEQVDEIVWHRPAECECGACLAGAPEIGEPARHQVFELPAVAAIVTEHRRVRVACPGCARKVLAELPAGCPAGAFGPRLEATVIALTATRLSREQVAALVWDCFGCPIAAASVQAICERASAALAPAQSEIENAIESAAVVNADETGWKVAGKTGFMWAARTDAAALFRIAGSRRQAEARALLGEGFTGIVGTDRYAGYAFLEAERRQVCWSHLARDFQALAERPRQTGALGRDLVAATEAMFATWHAERDQGRRPDWSKAPMAAHHDQIIGLLERGSRMRDAKAARFCEGLLAIWPSLWLFTEIDGVEPTNNSVERALRHAVIWRKLSFGTRTDRGSRFAERLLSVRETCRLQGRGLHGFLIEALTAQLNGDPPPTLLPP